MRAKFLAFCLLTGLAVPASATDWKLVSRAFAPQRVEVDRSSLSWNGDVVTVWTRVSAPVPTGEAAVGQAAVAPGSGTMTPYLMQVACDARLIRLSTASISAAQINPFGAADNSPFAFQTINNPVGFAVMSAACVKKPAPTVQYDPDEVRLNINPTRTGPHRNPWPFMATRGY